MYMNHYRSIFAFFTAASQIEVVIVIKAPSSSSSSSSIHHHHHQGIAVDSITFNLRLIPIHYSAPLGWQQESFCTRPSSTLLCTQLLCTELHNIIFHIALHRLQNLQCSALHRTLPCWTLLFVSRWHVAHFFTAIDHILHCTEFTVCCTCRVVLTHGIAPNILLA